MHQLKEHFNNIKAQEDSIRNTLQNENIVIKKEYEQMNKEYQTIKTQLDLQQEKFNNQLKNIKDKYEREINENNLKNISYQSQLQKDFSQKLENIKSIEKKRINDIIKTSNMEKQNLVDVHLQESDSLANQLNREFKQQMSRMENKFHDEIKKSQQLHEQVTIIVIIRFKNNNLLHLPASLYTIKKPL